MWFAPKYSIVQSFQSTAQITVVKRSQNMDRTTEHKREQKKCVKEY